MEFELPLPQQLLNTARSTLAVKGGGRRPPPLGVKLDLLEVNVVLRHHSSSYVVNLGGRAKLVGSLSKECPATGHLSDAGTK